MRSNRKPVEAMRAAARPVLTIDIDMGQLIAVLRRHVPMTPSAARAIRHDLARVFDTTRVIVVSSAPTRKAKAAADWVGARVSKGTP